MGTNSSFLTSVDTLSYLQAVCKYPVDNAHLPRKRIYGSVSRHGNHQYPRVQIHAQAFAGISEEEAARHHCGTRRTYKMNEDDLILGPYKLPLKKLKHGYFGAISITKDGTGIMCHVCGAIKENLSLHLRQHDITTRQYREKFGLTLQTRLVSEKFRNASIERMLALRAKLEKEGSLEKITRICNEKRVEDMKRRQANGTWKKGKTHLKPEDLNLRGICPDQLVEKIREAAKHYKATPSYAEFMAFHQTNRFAAPIRRTFGSWKEAVKKAGYEPKVRQFSKEGGRIKYEDEELLEILSNFYKDNGRLPTLSDFKRGFLPTWEVYTKRFGSMAEARSRAGLQVEVRRGGINNRQPMKGIRKQQLIRA